MYSYDEETGTHDERCAYKHGNHDKLYVQPLQILKYLRLNGICFAHCWASRTTGQSQPQCAK